MAQNKSLGQHWLKDQASLRSIVGLAELSASDIVLEIGPGQGDLTRLLSAQAGRVIAVEIDERLVAELKDRLKSENLEIISANILKFDLGSLPSGYKIVANIPYYLTSYLIRLISTSDNPTSLAVLLVQKEVAQRLAAKPGRMSLLSVAAQLYWQIDLGPIISANLFEPRPKVDSQVVVLRRREGVGENSSEKLLELAKLAFAGRRKTLLNSLSNSLGISKGELIQKLNKVQIDPGLRPQALSLSDWDKLTVAIYA